MNLERNHELEKIQEVLNHARSATPQLAAALKAVMEIHQPRTWTEYDIPTFDEFDRSIQTHNGCSCGDRYYPCLTVNAIYINLREGE